MLILFPTSSAFCWDPTLTSEGLVMPVRVVNRHTHRHTDAHNEY